MWLPGTRTTGQSKALGHASRLPAVGATCALVVLFRGSLNHVSRLALVLGGHDAAAVVVRLLLSLRELTALTESRRHQALTDELTGLENRRFLMAALDDYFAERTAADDTGHRLALLLIDLDHFKEINDRSDIRRGRDPQEPRSPDSGASEELRRARPPRR